MNHYGWFERVERGVYRLHPAGIEALGQYKERIPVLEEMTEEALRARDGKKEDML